MRTTFSLLLTLALAIMFAASAPQLIESMNKKKFIEQNYQNRKPPRGKVISTDPEIG